MIKRQSGEALQNLVDSINLLIQSLPNLGVELNNWDPMLKFIIEGKLDHDSRKDWKL